MDVLALVTGVGIFDEKLCLGYVLRAYNLDISWISHIDGV